jgi:hypothetical protein
MDATARVERAVRRRAGELDDPFRRSRKQDVTQIAQIKGTDFTDAYQTHEALRPSGGTALPRAFDPSV